MTDFVHLHTHSYYSILDGLSSPEELVKYAKELGQKSLALTDHGTCAGLYTFQESCKKYNIKPILGIESYITPDHSIKEKGTPTNHIVLLAKNKVGYKNLIYLSSFGYIHGFYYKPRIDFEILKEHSKGLIVTTACGNGVIPDLLWNGKIDEAKQEVNKFKKVFGDDFYIEIMRHFYHIEKEQEEKEKRLASLLYKFAKEMNVKAICTQDTHYAKPEQWYAHDVLLSVSTRTSIKNPNRMSFGSKDFYLKSSQEMAKLYHKAPELLENTLEISSKINDEDLVFPSEDLLPEFNIPEGFKDGEHYLKELIKDGMKNKGLINKPEYRKRIKHEMDIITRCNYTKYFLILWDIINFAQINNIRIGPGRGSAVSSLCLYVLGITKLDPLKYDLIFERFLNPERISPPDVDVDFDYYRRHEVYDYVVRKYGTNHCCQIGTYNKYKAKATARVVAKAMDIGNDWEPFLKQKNNNLKEPSTRYSLELSDRIAKTIPMKAKNITEAMRMSEDFRNYMQKYPSLLKVAKYIEGTISSPGVHPAGICICKTPIIEQVPLRVKQGVVASQYDMHEVEELGLLKFDLLAIKTLTVIDKTERMVKERHENAKDLNTDSLEPNDANVFAMLNGEIKNMDTKGIFQFEADGISQLLANIHVDRFEDMIVANALYRPGPLGGGVHDMYCNYKHGRKKIQYLHPKMGEVLKDTYGIMVFQEDAMKIAVELAGFTGGQADTLRKAMGKKLPEVMAKQKELFISGCVKNGIDQSIAIKIFEQIDYFSGYGFNKSHSAGYSNVAYQTAYLKYYYPIEFICNLLSSEIGNEDKLSMYLRVADRMRIICMPPDINKSKLEFNIEKGRHKKTGDVFDVLRKPLTILKGVGLKAVENIVQNQPFDNLEDFIKKINSRIVNKTVFKTLVEQGCMDMSWGVDHDILLKQYGEAKNKLDKEKKARKKQIEKMKETGPGSLFGDEFDFSGKNLEL